MKWFMPILLSWNVFLVQAQEIKAPSERDCSKRISVQSDYLIEEFNMEKVGRKLMNCQWIYATHKQSLFIVDTKAKVFDKKGRKNFFIGRKARNYYQYDILNKEYVSENIHLNYPGIDHGVYYDNYLYYSYTENSLFNFERRKQSKSSLEDPEKIVLDGKEVLHPAIQKINNIDYLVFSRKIEERGYDLFFSKNIDGKWSGPAPIEELNSPYDEIFPYLDTNGDLFFSSNIGKWPLMDSVYIGKYNIWKAPRTTSGDWNSKEVNMMPPPINSSGNDYKIISTNAVMERGFVMSDRRNNGKVRIFEYHKCEDENPIDTYGIIIGLGQYYSYEILENPSFYTEKLEELLTSKYDPNYKNNIITLIDAAPNEIFKAFENVKLKMDDNDQLLVYLTGHGELSDDKKAWFFVVPDKTLTPPKDTFISTVFFYDFLTDPKFKAEQVLFLIDACYSATFIREMEKFKKEENLNIIGKSKCIISADFKNQELSDDSCFSNCLIDFLKEYKNKSGSVYLIDHLKSLQHCMSKDPSPACKEVLPYELGEGHQPFNLEFIPY